MKTLVEYINENQEEQVNESFLEPILRSINSTLLYMFFSMIGMFIANKIRNKVAATDFVQVKSKLVPSFIKKWIRDKKICAIIDRLCDDEDMIAFFSQPKSKQHKGWRALLDTELTDEEKEFITAYSLSKDEMKTYMADKALIESDFRKIEKLSLNDYLPNKKWEYGQPLPKRKWGYGTDRYDKHLRKTH